MGVRARVEVKEGGGCWCVNLAWGQGEGSLGLPEAVEGTPIPKGGRRTWLLMRPSP